MKPLIMLILTVFSYITFGQDIQQYNPYNKYPQKKEWKYKEAVKTIAVYSSSIILSAVGDGLNDSGNKMYGHTCNAISTGLLVASPFILDVKKHNWGWYAATYLSFRIAFFDPAYNVSRGLPIGQIGTSNLWDKTLQAFKTTPESLLLGRGLFFVVAISIPLGNL